MDEFDNLIEKELENIENNRSKNSSAEKVYNKKETYDLAMKILSMKEYKFYTIRSKDRIKEMPMYKTELGYYVPFGETYIHQWCSKNFRTSDDKVIKELLTTIHGRTFIDRCDFIHPVNLINLKNGVFNLDNGELLNHASKYNFQGILNISYDKNAKCPKWEAAIKGMMPDDEDRIRTQKWFGYQFIRENKEQIAHGYYGVSGSGKSKILMILRDLLGEKNVTNFELQDFNSSNDYAVGRLYGKYANINYDMSTTQIKDISIFKKLTSGDPIKGRNIYESPFEFVNYAKLSWACNKLPTITDNILETKEFERRIMLTEVIIGHTEVDKDIYSKFRSELTGIFNWAIEGHKLYLEDKGFNFNHENVRSIWKKNMDNGNLTVYETIQKGDEYFVTNVCNRIKLENQESELMLSLKIAQENHYDKTVQNAIINQLKTVQEQLETVKHEILKAGDN